jgi:hypothetical protein
MAARTQTATPTQTPTQTQTACPSTAAARCTNSSPRAPPKQAYRRRARNGSATRTGRMYVKEWYTKMRKGGLSVWDGA